MQLKFHKTAALGLAIGLIGGCDAKKATVEKGREAVSQPFKTLNNVNDSLKQSEDKQKAALEEANKEIK